MKAPHPPAQPQLARPRLNANEAKRLFRSLLPMFAHFWREASRVAPEDSSWPDYERVLLACQKVLEHAPMHPNEARQINAERHLEHALEYLAEALATVLPSGLGELDFYKVSRKRF